MKHLLTFTTKVHIPIFILYLLLTTPEITREQLVPLFSLNAAFLLTTATYFAFFSHLLAVRSQTSINKFRLRSMFGTLIGWILFFTLLDEYIEGLYWFLIFYVIVTTWAAWVFAATKKADAKTIQPIEHLSLEYLSVSLAAMTGLALNDLGLFQSLDWIYISLLLINISLILNEFLFTLCKAGYISKKIMFSVILWFIIVINSPLLFAAFPI